MAPTLRKSTQDKTQASADAASKAGFVRKPRAPVTRRQRYARNKGLVSMKTPKELQHITIANADSPLLRLPPEIRNMIFKYATKSINTQLFFNRKRVLSRNGASTYMRSYQNEYAQFRLHHVCRQLHAETALLIYELNTFSFNTCQGLQSWLGRHSAAQREAIKSLELSDWVIVKLDTSGKELAEIEKELRSSSLPSLKYLSFSSDIADALSEARCEIADDIVSNLSTDDDHTWSEVDDCSCSRCTAIGL